jgi:nitrogen fixation-related uncharacterized protein
MLALTQDSAAAIISMIAIVIGFVVCGVLWWVMVGKPARDERRRRPPS